MIASATSRAYGYLLDVVSLIVADRSYRPSLDIDSLVIRLGSPGSIPSSDMQRKYRNAELTLRHELQRFGVVLPEMLRQ